MVRSLPSLYFELKDASFKGQGGSPSLQQRFPALSDSVEAG
jgi:hypothetical protein